MKQYKQKINFNEFAMMLKNIIDDSHVSTAIPRAVYEDIKQSYSIKRKREPPNLKATSIVDLLPLYETSKVDIASISFKDTLSFSKNFICFGYYEQDELAIERNEGEIVLLEEGSDYIMLEVAKDEFAFFAALLMIANCSYQNLLLADEEVEKFACSCSERCSEIAGGEKYLRFYENVLGCYQ